MESGKMFYTCYVLSYKCFVWDLEEWIYNVCLVIYFFNGPSYFQDRFPSSDCFENIILLLIFRGVWAIVSELHCIKQCSSDTMARMLRIQVLIETIFTDLKASFTAVVASWFIYSLFSHHIDQIIPGFGSISVALYKWVLSFQSLHLPTAAGGWVHCGTRTSASLGFWQLFVQVLQLF